MNSKHLLIRLQKHLNIHLYDFQEFRPVPADFNIWKHIHA